MSQTPKSPDQIQQQLDVVNLERHLGGQALLGAGAVAAGNEQHGEYVASLRELRRAQREFLKENETAMDRGTGSLNHHADFLREAEFSPKGWQVLSEVARYSFFGDSLSDSQRQQGAQSLGKLLEAADQAIDSGTERVVMQRLPAFRRLWGDERVGMFLDDLTESYPTVLLANAERLASQSGLEEERVNGLIAKAVDTLLSGADDAPFNLQMLIDPANRAVLTEEHQARLTQKALLQSSHYGNQATYNQESTPVLHLLQAGLVDEAAIAKGLEGIVSGEEFQDGTMISQLGKYVSILERAGNLGAVRELIQQGFQSGTIHPSWLPRTGILTMAQKAEVFDSILSQSPEKAWHNESTIKAAIGVVGGDKVVEVFKKSISVIKPKDAIDFIAGEDGEALLSPSERQIYLKYFIEQEPQEALIKADVVVAVFGQVEAGDIVRTAVESINGLSSYDVFGAALKTWLPLLVSDREAQQQTVLALMGKSKDLKYLYDYQAKDSLLAELVTLESLSEIVKSQLMDKSLIIWEEDTARLSKIFDKETLSGLLADMALINPDGFLDMYREMPDSIDRETAQALLRQIAAAEPRAILERSVALRLAYSPEEQIAVLDEIAAHDPVVFVKNLHSVFSKRLIRREKRDAYYEAALAQNPAVVYLYATGKKWQSKAVEAMKVQASHTGYMPNWYKQFFTKFQKSNENGKSILMSEAMVLYEHMAAVAAKSPDMLSKVAELSQKPNEQAEIVAKLAFIAKHSEGESLRPEEINSIDGLRSRVFSVLEDVIGIKLGETARQRIEAVFEPFVVYLDAFSGSDEHMHLLREIAHCSSDEQFRSFRLGENNQAGLEALKKLGLLPSNLTIEQYAEWHKDRNLVSSESMKASADDVVRSIHEIIEANAEYFELQVSDLKLSNAQLSSLKQDLAEVGRRMSPLQKEMTRRENSGADTSDVESVLADIRLEKARIEGQLAIHNLLSLDAEAVSAGGIVKEGKITQPTLAIIDKLTNASAIQNLHQDAVLAINHLRTIVNDYQTATAEEREISVEETIDLKTMLEIGDKPIGTCQNYATGEYREALLGYTDLNTKIIAVHHGNSLIARCVQRLMEDEDGNSVLHLETIYSQSASPVVASKIYRLALEKAEAMGIAVYVSRRSQNAGGGTTKAIETADTKFVESGAALSVHGVRAPFVYVDSLRGVRDSGYTIRNVSELRAA